MQMLYNIDFTHCELLNVTWQNLAVAPSSPQEGWVYYDTSDHTYRGWNGSTWIDLSSVGGGGSVTTVSVVSANGFAGTVANASTTPAITISTTVTGLLKGNGTAISAATAGTDYAVATNGTNGQVLTSNGSGGFGTPLAATITIAGTAVSLGGAITLDTITGLASTGLVKRTAANTLAIAASGTDYAPATNGTTGQLLVSNGTGGFGTPLTVSTDGTLSGNSDSNISTQKAVKTYVDGLVSSAMHFKGSINASTNPNYPAATIGDTYVISAAGKVGGASGVSVDVGDMIVATATNAGGTQASVGASWDVIEHNLVGALLAANNLSDLQSASTARTNLGLRNLAVLDYGSDFTTSGNNLILASTVPHKYAATIGNGSLTSIAVTHGLGTQDVVVSVREVSTNKVVYCDVTMTSTTQVTLAFTSAPASNSLRVTIIG